MSYREVERRRYNSAAKEEQALTQDCELAVGVDGLPVQFHPPYRLFNEHIRAEVEPDSVVLELGAGTGRHTVELTRFSRCVVALDISEEALKLCAKRTDNQAGLICGDIARLPLASRSIDVVVSAGSLSYGEPNWVNSEIRRVLRPGGTLLVVDSLQHNPIWRFKRRFDYFRGKRSLATIRWMPNSKRISQLSRGFDAVRVDYFGTYVFGFPLLARLIGEKKSLEALERLDARAGQNAFKFVLLAQGFTPEDTNSS